MGLLPFVSFHLINENISYPKKFLHPKSQFCGGCVKSQAGAFQSGSIQVSCLCTGA